jgi:uncharacterized NAD(P)/FAD-binding protein YdhS
MSTQKISIVGAGFAGTMLAINCISRATKPLEINIIDENGLFARGIAYTPYSSKHLLNVVAGKMSAFAKEPGHFLDWLSQQPRFKNIDRNLISNAFLPRRVYGEYMEQLWKNMKKDLQAGVTVNEFHSSVKDVEVDDNGATITLENGTVLKSDKCIIATGNANPRNPAIKTPAFYNSKKYFRNPWSKESVSNLNNDVPVLIIGNGLTMVDTVAGLLEQGFHNTIYSISPNGFNILPHRHSAIQYGGLLNELPENPRLQEIASLIFKHVRIVRSFGVTAEPVIDSLRPLTQKIWQQFSDEEKRVFMSRFRHLWGVARHRIPLHVYDNLQRLKEEGRLKIISGSLIDITETGENIQVRFFNKKHKEEETVTVQRVINCTGPDSDINNIPFLSSCHKRGYIKQDALKLGISTDPSTFETIGHSNQRNKNLLAIGSLLRGELWESTAVNELRSQSATLAEKLIANN